ncbi:hypothetical protein [Sulfurimonas sp.]
MDYIVKAFIFVPFMAVIYVFVDYFKSILASAFSSLSVTSLMCQFGVLDGFSVFFTIIISAFAAKQAISFAK